MQHSPFRMAAAVEAAILNEVEGLTAAAQVYLGHRKTKKVEEAQELITLGRQLISKKWRGKGGVSDPYTREERSALLAVMNHSLGHFPLIWLADFAGVGYKAMWGFFSAYGVPPEMWNEIQKQYEATLLPVVPDSQLDFADLCLAWMASEIDEFDAVRVHDAYLPQMKVEDVERHLEIKRGWRLVDKFGDLRINRVPRILRNGIISFERKHGGDYSDQKAAKFFGVSGSSLSVIFQKAELTDEMRKAHAKELRAKRFGTLSIENGRTDLVTVAWIQILANFRKWPLSDVRAATGNPLNIESLIQIDIKQLVRKLERSSGRLYEDEDWLIGELLTRYAAEIRNDDIQNLLGVSKDRVHAVRKKLNLPLRSQYNSAKQHNDQRYLEVPDSEIDWADRLYVAVITKIHGKRRAKNLIRKDPLFSQFRKTEVEDCFVRRVPYSWLYNSDPAPQGPMKAAQGGILRVMLSRHNHKILNADLARVFKRDPHAFSLPLRKAGVSKSDHKKSRMSAKKYQ